LRVRLLLVQGANPYRNITSQWLAALAGVSEVQVASAGLEALTFIAALAPDLVLVDAALPDMDGYEFTRQARLAAAKVRVVLMITVATERFAGWAKEAGADHAMEKSRLHSELPPILAALA
jgi:CheY-like chemotaxis protein